jgi:hypothetical protein
VDAVPEDEEEAEAGPAAEDVHECVAVVERANADTADA